MKFHNIAARLIQVINPQPAANDSTFVSEHDQRVERLKAKQKAMFNEMMANGTHMFCRPTYHAGDSHVLREAGLVK